MDLHNAFIECLAIGDDYISVENSGDYFVYRDGDKLKIFFEWSDGATDWRHNLSFLAIPQKPYKNMKRIWFAHRGFLKVWKSLEPYIAEAITPDVKRIEIVGYSHGAAIALLCYEYCAFNFPNIAIEGAGFGCPRVFWGIVPREVKKRLSGFKVVRNGIDLVTHVPPALFGFSHVGEVVKIGKSGLIKDHFPGKYEIHLREEMEFDI